MFNNASKFNGNISTWDVSNVETMEEMFENASSFNGDISNWNVSNVKDMSYMFHIATSFNQDISNWDVSSVLEMSEMFKGASSFNQDISNLPVGIKNLIITSQYNKTKCKFKQHIDCTPNNIDTYPGKVRFDHRSKT